MDIHQRLLAVKLQDHAARAFRRTPKINQPDPGGILARLRHLTPGRARTRAVSRNRDDRIHHQCQPVIRSFRDEPNRRNQIDHHSRALLVLGNQDVLDRSPSHIDH